MKTKIDLDKYKRRNMFIAFKDREIPYFSTTSNVEITNLKKYIDGNNCGFFLAISFLISKAINLIPELRHRIINGELYEFDKVDPGYTVLLSDETFSFCDSCHFDKFNEYSKYAAMRINEIKNNPDQTTEEKHHMFFITNIPWFSFTSIVHPYSKQYGSLPVVAVGRYFEQDKKLILPVGIQVHHGLVDGFHVGKFYTLLSEMCYSPSIWLNAEDIKF